MLALGGAGVFALFSVLGKKYQYDQVVSVFIYFVTALVFIPVLATWTIRSKIRPFKRENSPTLLVNRGGLVYNQTSSTASPLLE